MLPYSLTCRKNTESKNPEVVRAKNARVMPVSKCEVCDSTKWKFVKKLLDY